jgi:hypothetical protein
MLRAAHAAARLQAVRPAQVAISCRSMAGFDGEFCIGPAILPAHAVVASHAVASRHAHAAELAAPIAAERERGEEVSSLHYTV